MDQRIIDLYDSFTHGGIDRRDVPRPAGARSPDRARRRWRCCRCCRTITPAPRWSRPTMRGSPSTRYRMTRPARASAATLARLKAKGKRPAVIVIHENRGLNPHIQDIARRIALEGFLSLAVDMLSPLGGTPADEDKARDMIGTLNAGDTARRIAAAVPFLEQHAESTGKVGIVGFCWGGGIVNRVAVLAPDLKAGVTYYGAAAAGRPGHGHPSAAAAALCGARPARERGHRGL